MNMFHFITFNCWQLLNQVLSSSPSALQMAKLIRKLLYRHQQLIQSINLSLLYLVFFRSVPEACSALPNSLVMWVINFFISSCCVCGRGGIISLDIWTTLGVGGVHLLLQDGYNSLIKSCSFFFFLFFPLWVADDKIYINQFSSKLTCFNSYICC